MGKSIKYILFFLLFLAILAVFVLLIKNGNMQLLNPKGIIAQGQAQLLFWALLIALFVGLPVVILTLIVALRYSQGNEALPYTPETVGNKKLVFLWWSVPAVIVLFWAIVGWQSAHTLDPYKPLHSSQTPVDIQVVALQWKWLFIYPQEHIATVNMIEIPQNTPIDFQLTADAPMNSFWIPSLGGQIYAMPGMETQLHLLANTTGTYAGGGAEMSGAGFAGMNFRVQSVNANTYTTWIHTILTSQKELTPSTYNILAEPSSYSPPIYYGIVDQNLFNEIMMKYIVPSQQAI